MKHLILSVESALESGNSYAALAVALTLPDICGWISDPTAGSKARYIAWFEKYLQHKYYRPAGKVVSAHTFLSGSDCYALRCAYLHEGREDITEQRAQQVLDTFQFVVPPPGWIVHCNQNNNSLQLQVDVFCRDVIEGVEQFINDVANNSDASNRISQLLLVRDVNGQPI